MIRFYCNVNIHWWQWSLGLLLHTAFTHLFPHQPFFSIEIPAAELPSSSRLQSLVPSSRRNAHYVLRRENEKMENMEESKWKATKKMEERVTKTGNSAIPLSYEKKIYIKTNHYIPPCRMWLSCPSFLVLIPNRGRTGLRVCLLSSVLPGEYRDTCINFNSTTTAIFATHLSRTPYVYNRRMTLNSHNLHVMGTH
jgi:hypothetical protein